MTKNFIESILKNEIANVTVDDVKNVICDGIECDREAEDFTDCFNYPRFAMYFTVEFHDAPTYRFFVSDFEGFHNRIYKGNYYEDLGGLYSVYDGICGNFDMEECLDEEGNDVSDVMYDEHDNVKPEFRQLYIDNWMHISEEVADGYICEGIMEGYSPILDAVLEGANKEIDEYNEEIINNYEKAIEDCKKAYCLEDEKYHHLTDDNFMYFDDEEEFRKVKKQKYFDICDEKNKIGYAVIEDYDENEAEEEEMFYGRDLITGEIFD